MSTMISAVVTNAQQHVVTAVGAWMLMYCFYLKRKNELEADLTFGCFL